MNKKNHSQSGGSDQGNTSPSVNSNREADKLGSSESETANWGIPGNTYNGEGDDVNQRLGKEGPPREPRYASRCPARGDLTAEKEQHHEIDHGRPPGIYDLRFRTKVVIPLRIATYK